MPLFWILLVLAVGCGGKGAASGADAKTDVDADALALLPASALVVGSIEVRALAATSSGPAFLAIGDSFVPLGDDADFKVSRDVDKVVVAAYAANEADIVGVLTGRFDVDKIGAATRTRQGGPIVHATYAGFATDVVDPISIAALTPHTIVAGTTERVHRVLDRIQQHSLTRAVPSWMADTLGSPGTAFTAAADFSSTPVAAATIGAVNLEWLKGLQAARVLGDFNPPGLNVAATLTYGDATGAQAAVKGVQQLDAIQKLLGPAVLGAKAENVRVSATGTDASCQFAVSDASLQALVALAGRYARPSLP